MKSNITLPLRSDERCRRKSSCISQKITAILGCAGMLTCILIGTAQLSSAGISDQNIPKSSSLTLDLFGFIEFENFIDAYRDQDFSDAVKKNEIRSHLEGKYGTRNMHLAFVTDLYYLPELFNTEDEYDYRYTTEKKVYRNLRAAGPRYEWSFDELFMNVMLYPLRLRLGNQIYKWGTADVFNPTSYFYPNDFREFFLKDDDELKQGIPSFSAMYFSDGYTVELVLSFVHVPMLFAIEDDYWNLDLSNDLFSLSIQNSEGLDLITENMGVGFRISTNIFQADISVSAYHGPDRDAVLLPSGLSFETNQPFSVILVPQYYIVNTVGMDFSKPIGDAVFQFEVAYSPDKTNFVEQHLTAINDLRFPYVTRKSDYISYAAGFTYFIPLSSIFESHEGETVFMAEWFQSHYFDDELYRPTLSDLVILHLRDNFFGGRLNPSMTAIFETRDGGTLFKPSLIYDFQNGFLLEIAYAAIDGKDNSQYVKPMFYHFRDNDIVSLEARYAF